MNLSSNQTIIISVLGFVVLMCVLRSLTNTKSSQNNDAFSPSQSQQSTGVKNGVTNDEILLRDNGTTAEVTNIQDKTNADNSNNSKNQKTFEFKPNSNQILTFEEDLPEPKIVRYNKYAKLKSNKRRKMNSDNFKNYQLYDNESDSSSNNEKQFESRNLRNNQDTRNDEASDEWFESYPGGGEVLNQNDEKMINSKYQNFMRYTPDCPVLKNGWKNIGVISDPSNATNVFSLCAKPDELESEEDRFRSHYNYAAVMPNKIPIYLNEQPDDSHLINNASIAVPGYNNPFKITLFESQNPNYLHN